MVERCKDAGITILPSAGPVAEMFNGKKIASSTRARDLKEGQYPAVVYVPRADTVERFLAPQSTSATAPSRAPHAILI